MQLAKSNSDCFEIVAPTKWSLPVVLSSPHSGSAMPRQLLDMTKLPATALHRSEDSFVHELFAPCVDCGVPLLHALTSRAFVDLNREPYELDSRMFSEPLPAYMNVSSPRVIAGLGTIPRIAGDGEVIYHQKLNLSDALARIENYYRPYHQALSALLDHVYREAGFVCLLDCHSMPESALTDKSVDIVLGDRYGTSCTFDIMQSWRDGLKAAGLNVKLNHPYPGGFITETHGRPRAGRNALQIEINRALFVKSGGHKKTREFKEIQTVIKSVFESFASVLPDFSLSAAAE